MNSISFHSEGVRAKTPSKRLLKGWIKEFVSNHDKKVGEIAFVFCDDEKILEVNRNFLQHDYYTDIITFDYSEENKISGDLFISVERVKDNALKIGVSLQNEMQRVVIHGVLHLCGFKDKEKTDVQIMRKMEEKALLLFPLK